MKCLFNVYSVLYSKLHCDFRQHPPGIVSHKLSLAWVIFYYQFDFEFDSRYNV